MEHGPEAVRRTITVIRTPIDAIDWSGALRRIEGWAQAHESRSVCICNAHSLVTAADRSDFALALAQADMATPDGAPIAWMLRALGAPRQERINGPDLMLRYCEQAATTGTSVYLLGGRADTLQRLSERLTRQFPGLHVAGGASPPFRDATPQETEQQVRAINDSGAGVVFVGLGCPKQELWMAAQRGKVHAVMIGVGAAFDFHAGNVKRAPPWMQRIGLEWLHRLLAEPRRLWRRYLVTNTAFVARAGWQLLTRRQP